MDPQIIESSLAAIEQSLADIRAELSKNGEAGAAPGNPGAMSTPAAPAGGKGGLEAFLGK